MLKRLLFGSKKDSSAQVAKDRLQIIIAHQRADGKPPIDMDALEADVLVAIKKHIDIDENDFEINLDEGELDICIDLSKLREKKDAEEKKEKSGSAEQKQTGNGNQKPLGNTNKHHKGNRKKK